MLNLFLPGAGQLYLGQRRAGATLMALFLGSFVGVVGIFLFDYARYLNLVLGGNILQGHRIEEAGAAFQVGWLLGLLVAGLAIYVGALAHLWLPSNVKPTRNEV